MGENYGRQDPAGLRQTGLALNFIGKVGQYASLAFGAYSISREDPSLIRAIIGGLGYGIFSSLEYAGNLFGFRAEGEILGEKEEKTRSLLDHMERKIKGRVIDASIFDPNKPDNTKLDELVRVGLDQELARQEKEDLQKLEEGIKKKGDSQKKLGGWNKS